jgi:hypothetical protein
MPNRTFLGWFCCCLLHDQVVCGGPPQPSNCWRGIATARCVCWWSGSQFSRRIGDRQDAPRSDEFRMAGHGSSGIPDIW